MNEYFWYTLKTHWLITASAILVHSGKLLFLYRGLNIRIILVKMTLVKSALTNIHCVKSVQIQSFFWFVFSCIRSEYRKIRTRKNSVFGHLSRSDLTSLWTDFRPIRWNYETGNTKEDFKLTLPLHKHFLFFG